MIYAETDRLYLRQLAADDLPRLVELIGDWEVARWLGRVPYPYAMHDAEEWLAIQHNHYVADKPEYFVIADKTNNRLLGGVGLHPRMAYQSDTNSDIELGYWLGQPYWGLGIMSEAVNEVIRWGFSRFALTDMMSSTAPENFRSQNVLRKAGFSKQGLVPRPAEFLRGGPEILLWRLTRDAYQASLGITFERPRS